MIFTENEKVHLQLKEEGKRANICYNRGVLTQRLYFSCWIIKKAVPKQSKDSPPLLLWKFKMCNDPYHKVINYYISLVMVFYYYLLKCNGLL